MRINPAALVSGLAATSAAFPYPQQLDPDLEALCDTLDTLDPEAVFDHWEGTEEWEGMSACLGTVTDGGTALTPLCLKNDPLTCSCPQMDT